MDPRPDQVPLRPALSFWHRPPAWLALALVPLLFARRPDAFLKPQLFAEDGLFYGAMLERGLRSLFEPYAGYLHFAPRLAAWLATLVDPLWAPAVMNASSVAAIILLATYAISSRNPLPHRMWIALAAVLLPGAQEVFFTATNIQWTFALTLIVLLVLDDPGSRLGMAADFGFSVIAGLTGPFSTVLAPLFIWRAVRRRTVAATSLAAVITLTGIIQAWFIVHDESSVVANPVAWQLVFPILGRRFGVLLFGLGRAEAFLAEFWLGLLGVLAVALLSFVASVPGAFRRQRVDLALAAAFLLAAGLFRFRHELPDLLLAGERYFLAAQAILLWLIVLCPSQKPAWSIVYVVLCAGFLGTAAAGFRLEPFTDFHWSTYAARIRAGEPTLIPINPDGWTFEYRGRK